ncbi:MAG: hypothetical protein AAGA57_12495 [Planctomycetota bacterium]
MKQFDAMRKGLVGTAVLVAGWVGPGEAVAQERTIGVIRNAPERKVGVIGQLNRRPLSNFFVNTESTRLVDLRRALGVDRDGVFVGGIRPQPTPFTLEGIRDRAVIDNPTFRPRDRQRVSPLRLTQPGVERYVTRSGMTITRKVSPPSTASAAPQAASAPRPPAYTSRVVLQMDGDLQPGQLVLSVGGAEPVLITEEPAEAASSAAE